MAAWDRCVDPDLTPVLAKEDLQIYVAVDASHKHDSTAVCAVHFDRKAQQVRLIAHRVFQPTPDQPLDFEQTIEQTLLELRSRFLLRKCLFDPWQMQASAQRLAKAGIRIEEFPQSPANLTSASQNLYDLIEAQAITLYPDQQMRLAASRAVAIETPRGWKIGKQQQTHKIDLIVALAMASWAAVQGQKDSTYISDLSWVSDRANAIAEADAFQQARFRQHVLRTGGFYNSRRW